MIKFIKNIFLKDNESTQMTFKLSIISLFILLIGNFVFADSFTVKQGQTDIIVLTDSFPPFSYQNDKGERLGSADKSTEALFKKAGINYSIQNVPWKRAFKQLEQYSNLLIYPLSRTKEREDKFLWIAPLYTLEHKIYALRKKFENKTVDITSGDYKFVCFRITNNCDVLQEMNVPESSLVKINNVNIPQILKMINLEHVDFILLPEIDFDYAAKLYNINPEKFIFLNNNSYPITDYLAANLNLDKSIVKQLKAVAKPLSP